MTNEKLFMADQDDQTLLYRSKDCTIAINQNEKQKFIISEYRNGDPVLLSLPLQFHKDIYDYFNFKRGVRSENEFLKSLSHIDIFSKYDGPVHLSPYSKNPFEDFKKLLEENNPDKINEFLKDEYSGLSLVERKKEKIDPYDITKEKEIANRDLVSYLEKLIDIQKSYEEMMTKFSVGTQNKISKMCGFTTLNENKEKETTSGGHIELNNNNLILSGKSIDYGRFEPWQAQKLIEHFAQKFNLVVNIED